MLRHFLKIAFRNLWKYKTQNAINILGLSVSLACFTVCFLLVRSFTGMDKDIPDVNRIYAIMNKDSKRAAVGRLIMEEYPDIEKYAAINSEQGLVFELDDQNTNKKYELNSLEVTPSFFDFFPVSFIGRYLPDFEAIPNAVFLIESTAFRLYGTEPAAGKKIIIKKMRYTMEEGYHEVTFSYTVCGVIKDFPDFSYINRFFSGDKINALFVNDKPDNSELTVVKLKPTVSEEQFNKKLAGFPPKLYQTPGISVSGQNENGFYIIPYTKLLREVWGTQFYELLGKFGGLGILVLLISIFNYILYAVNLFHVKKHEFAIRKSANAGKWQLFFMFFNEIAIVIIMAGVFAACWIELFYSYIETPFYSIKANYIHIIQYVATGLILAFLLCIIPVSKINRESVKDTLFGGKSKNPKSKAQNVFLGIQLFISALFISASIFIYLQFNHITNSALETLTKEEKENIVEMNVSQAMLSANINDIVAKLTENPYIEDLYLSGLFKLMGRGFISVSSLEYEGKNITISDMPSMKSMNIGYNYFDFIHLPVIEGRLWEEGESDAIIISKRAKELLQDQDVIGKQIKVNYSSGTIVGVVEDVINDGVGYENRAAFYTGGIFRHSNCYLYVKINPEKRKECLEYINKVIREYIPETIEFRLISINQIISDTFERDRHILELSVLFSIVSIIISLFGVYVSITLTTKRRQKEVAIRKINGAELPDIIRLFLRTYLGILLIAIIPAFVTVYFLMNKWLEDYAYRISLSWYVFAMIFTGLAILLVLTVISRLIKVARINPAQIVKSK